MITNPLIETRKLTYREFFQWYFGVKSGHVFDAPLYRHGSAHQCSEHGMNFTNRLDAFKYECETQDHFLVLTNGENEHIPIQICEDEIFPVIDSEEITIFELHGDEYCFTLPSGRELQLCCQEQYTPDWRH